MFECEGLKAIETRFSILLSFSRNKLLRASRVVFFVSFPRNTGCYKSHLSTKTFKASLFSILKEHKKFTESNGLLLIIRAQTRTNPCTVVASLDLNIL